MHLTCVHTALKLYLNLDHSNLFKLGLVKVHYLPTILTKSTQHKTQRVIQKVSTTPTLIEPNHIPLTNANQPIIEVYGHNHYVRLQVASTTNNGIHQALNYP